MIFPRGPESPTRDAIVNRIMDELNPDLNHIRAIRIAMKSYIGDGTTGARRAAYRTCKNLVSKILTQGTHQETFILVDNPNLQDTHWNSFCSLAQRVGAPGTIMVGLDIGDRKNLHDPKSDMFILSSDKYVCVETETDSALDEWLNDIKKYGSSNDV